MMSPILGPCLSLTAFPRRFCFYRLLAALRSCPCPESRILSPVRAPPLPGPCPRPAPPLAGTQPPLWPSGLCPALTQPALALWQSVVLPLHQAPSQPVPAVFGLQPPHPAWLLTGLLNLLFSELAVLFYRSTDSSRCLCPERRH